MDAPNSQCVGSHYPVCTQDQAQVTLDHQEDNGLSLGTHNHKSLKTQEFCEEGQVDVYLSSTHLQSTTYVGQAGEVKLTVTSRGRCQYKIRYARLPIKDDQLDRNLSKSKPKILPISHIQERFKSSDNIYQLCWTDTHKDEGQHFLLISFYSKKLVEIEG